jgi:hypothetical protein
MSSEQSLQLVGKLEDGSLEVPEAAAALLSSIKEHVSVVVVAGPYRTGKSFLLNCLSDHPVRARPHHTHCESPCR